MPRTGPINIQLNGIERQRIARLMHWHSTETGKHCHTCMQSVIQTVTQTECQLACPPRCIVVLGKFLSLSKCDDPVPDLTFAARLSMAK